MFNHILSCKRVLPEKVHPELFKGCYKIGKRGLHLKPSQRKQIEKKRIEKKSKVNICFYRLALQNFSNRFFFFYIIQA